MVQPVKSIVFGKGLLVPTLTGNKQITIRKYRPEAHNFKKGEVAQGVFMEGLTIPLEITQDTETGRFKNLPDSVAQEDGFRDAKEAFMVLQNEYYQGNLKKSDPYGAIRYRVLRHQDEPVVSINEHITPEDLAFMFRQMDRILSK